MSRASGERLRAEAHRKEKGSAGGPSWLYRLLGGQPANQISENRLPAVTVSPPSIAPAVSASSRLSLRNWFFLGGAEIMEVDITRPEFAAKSQHVEPETVERILTSGAGPNSPKQSFPPTRVGVMASPTSSNDSRPPSSSNIVESQKHDSAIIASDEFRKTNRFSVSFPVQPSTLGVDNTNLSRRASPSPLFDPTFTFPSQTQPVAAQAQPSAGNEFLTALAAQERRVLELKEELQKAEQDLGNLKRQWALQENIKKQQDAHHIQPLQPLVTDLKDAPDDDSDGTSAWMQKEMEKRKTSANGQRAPHRRVFSGSRHTRALSLLSPQKTDQEGFPQSTKADLKKEPKPEPRKSRPISIARMNTAPNLLDQIGDTNIMDDITSPTSEAPKEAFRISRQMAADFKEGLWTFFEDLRQATVGDESVSGAAAQLNKPAGERSKHTGKTTRFVVEHNKSHNRTTSTPDSGCVKTDPSMRSSAQRASRASPSKQPEDKTPRRPAISRKQSTEIWTKDVAKHTQEASAGSPLTSSRTKPISGRKDVQHIASEPEEPWDQWDTPDNKARFTEPTSDTSPSATPTSTAATSITDVLEAKTFDQYSITSTPQSKDIGIGTPTIAKKDPIPWPALQKLSPGNLKRTASNLMSEWEKSLTPSPQDKGTREDYLGWASPSPPSTVKRGGKKD
ncbi:MAG: hypothetical protein M1820_008094 [Bogoriella megaspora]|nr:MAG: hypothetical protein M1820_008094 [Bogoriella megaspora]